MFCDTFPNIMMGLLGGTDTIVGSGPYAHTIKLLNSASTGSQPPSYTAFDVDQIVESSSPAKQLAGSQFGECEIDFSATGALGWSAKLVANPYTEVALPTATFSTEVFVPAYNATISFASDTAPIIDGKLTIQRNAAAIFVLGQQGPYVNWADVITVTGSLTFLVLSGDTTLTQGLTYAKQVATLKFTDPISSHFVQWTMSQCQFKSPKIDRGSSYVKVTADFEGESNSTDASTGYAPIQFEASNAQSTAY